MKSNQNTHQPIDPRPRHGAGLTLAFLGLFLAGASILWATHWTRGRAACDQYDYHLKAILKFAGELPRPDLRDYASATTPGYHLVLAAFAQLGLSGTTGLQVIASVFTLALLAGFAGALARAGEKHRRSGLPLFALGLPMVASPYVFTSGVWLLPDNAGWLLVLATLWPCVRGPMSGRTLAWCGAMLGVLVLVRQSHLWVAAPLCAAAWMQHTQARDETLRGAISDPVSRLKWSLGALAACVPAIVIVGAFVHLWGGLTPPSFQVQHGSGINWSTFPFILSLIAAFSPFFAGWMWPGLAKAWNESRPLVVLAAVAGILVAALPNTTFLREPRSSGLWNVVGFMGDLGLNIHGHTSPLIVALAPIGAVMIVGWMAMIDDRRRWIVVTMLAAFAAAQAANANCWQRYHEPLLLGVFALIAAVYGANKGGELEERRPLLGALRIAGPLALAAGLALITATGLIKGRDSLQPNPKQSPVPVSHDPDR
jgi:hypothetical protein